MFLLRAAANSVCLRVPKRLHSPPLPAASRRASPQFCCSGELRLDHAGLGAGAGKVRLRFPQPIDSIQNRLCCSSSPLPGFDRQTFPSLSWHRSRAPYARLSYFAGWSPICHYTRKKFCCLTLVRRTQSLDVILSSPVAPIGEASPS